MQGYNGHIFAIALGETGTDFTLYPGDTRTLLDLASYVSLSNGADDGKHNAITSAFWWAWNANSGQGMFIITWQGHAIMARLQCLVSLQCQLKSGWI